MTTEVAYSTNDEEFNCLDKEELFDRMADEDTFKVGAVYYEVDIEEVAHTDYLRAWEILERAEEQLADEIGEAADDAFYASRSAKAELNEYLAKWAKEHLSGTYWKCVGKSREMRVTQEDIDGY